MRVESSTQGKLMELLVGTASWRIRIGTSSAGRARSRICAAKDAEEFYQKYYAPGNVTMAVVGDVKAADIRRLAEDISLHSQLARFLPPCRQWSRSRKERSALCSKPPVSRFC